MNFYSQKKILVTGGCGFIGFHLTKKLLEFGTQVTIFDQRRPKMPKVKFIKGSVADKRKITHTIEKKFDVIFHLAGKSGTVGLNAQQSFTTNCLGSINLLEAVRCYSPASVIVFSNSRQEYGKPQYLPVDELHPTQPLSHYGVHKLATTVYAQLYHQIFGLKTIVLRTSNIFGPYNQKRHDYNIVSQWLTQAQRGQNISLFGGGRQLRDYLYIDDFIAALLQAGTTIAARGQIINLGFGQGLSLSTITKTVASKFKVKVIKKPWPKDWQRVETGDYVTDITRAKRLLNWLPKTSFTQGVTLAAQA